MFVAGFERALSGYGGVAWRGRARRLRQMATGLSFIHTKRARSLERALLRGPKAAILYPGMLVWVGSGGLRAASVQFSSS